MHPRAKARGFLLEFSVIALFVGMAALSIMMGMLGDIGQFNKTELDVYAVEPGGTLDNPGDPTITDTPNDGGSGKDVLFIVVDQSGDPVTDVTLVVTHGTAQLDGAIRTHTGDASNKAQVDLSNSSLRRDQNKGTLEVEAVPPANSNYVDNQQNADVVVIEPN